MNSWHSIFTEPDWILQRALGWSVAIESSYYRALVKRRGPLKRILVLMFDCQNHNMAFNLSSRVERLFGLTQIVVQDFKDCHRNRLISAGFSLMPDENRLLNNATYIFDLSLSENQLLQNMESQTRRKVKKGQKLSLESKITKLPNASELKELFDEIKVFATQRGISYLSFEEMNRIFASGNAVLLKFEAVSGSPQYLIVYLAGDSGYFLHSARLEPKNDGLGHYIHMAAIKWLRENGYHYYDFGGVNDSSEAAGIKAFKQGFGGEFVELGHQWVKTGWSYKLAQKLMAWSSDARKSKQYFSND